MKYNLKELVEQRRNLMMQHLLEENVSERNKIGLRITTISNKLREYDRDTGENTEVIGVLPHSMNAIVKWSQGLCQDHFKCDSDTRKMGGCTCWNIAIEKKLDADLKF